MVSSARGLWASGNGEAQSSGHNSGFIEFRALGLGLGLMGFRVYRV